MSDTDFVEEHEEILPDELIQQAQSGLDETEKAEPETTEEGTDEQEPEQEATEEADKTEDGDEDAKPDQEESAADEGAEPGEEPAKLSKNQQRSLKIREQQERIAELEAAISEKEARLKFYEERQPLEPPKEDDFGGDWEAFERAQRQHEIKESVREQTEQDRKEALENERETFARERLKAQEVLFQEREDAAMRDPAMPNYTERVTDLTNRVKAAGGFPQHTIEEIAKDPNGPALLYLAASGEGEGEAFLREMFSDDPVSVARSIARRSAVLSTPPPPKKRTTAPEPVNPIKGGGEAVQKEPAQMTYAEYRKHRGFDKLNQRPT